jgi:ComF family protein
LSGIATLVPPAASADKGGMVPSIARMTAPVWQTCLSLALPPRCPGCGTEVDADHRFCAACWGSLDFLGEPACRRCGLPVEGVADPAGCDDCAGRPLSYEGVRAAVGYGDVARTVALRLKYGRRPGVARTMATLMARLATDLPADAVFVAVPLHRRRLWTRGYNQALLIACALARRSGHAWLPDGLVRTRATPVLQGLGRNARARAVADAFAVPVPLRSRIAGRTIALVDDVYTTGATVEACAAALRGAGAARVIVLCWARVVPER